MNVQRSLQQGFTLIEMLVIAPIVVLAIGAFLTVIISMTGEVLSSRGANTLAYNVQDALNRIDQDVKLSTTFLATNNIALTAGEAQGYNNDATNFTNVGGTSGTSLILSTLATTDNPTALTSGLVYLTDKPNACASDRVQDNTPMSINVVYFVKDSTLWRRTIMPSNYAAGTSVYCSAPWQQPSCAPGYTAVFCKTNDVKLVEGVSATAFSVQYFTSANATTANATASDAEASVTDRGTALQSLPTVGISIIASQNITGRSVERSATLRSTRLDTNASTIANYVAPTIPAAPTLSGSIDASDPTSVVYAWPKVDGAESYTFQYNFNGGAWQTPVTNQNVNTYTVEAAYNNRIVNARVTASNTAGTSGYGTTTTTVPLWATPALLNNWNNYGTPYAGVGFTKTSAGLVQFKGLIKRSGSPVSGEVITVLPEGFRPPYALRIQVGTNNAGGTIMVYPNGDVTSVSLNAGWASLTDVSFISSTAGYTPTPVTTLNSWVNYGSIYGTAAETILDSAGRVNVTGLLKSGSTSSEVNMLALPAGNIPPKRVYLPVAYPSPFGVVIADPSGYIKTGVTSSTYTAVNVKFYPAARPDGSTCTTSWCGLSMTAGWVPYGNSGSNYAQPQYTKGSDGLVMLRGLIKSGTTTAGTTITTLPAGYRPAERMIFQVNGGGTYGRIDVQPSGSVQVYSGVSSSYTALDTIYFMAEQ